MALGGVEPPHAASKAAALSAELQGPYKRGVAEGTRTPDHRDHNPGLYQLSYRHREQSQSSRVQPVTLHTGREAEADLRDRPRADQ